MSNDEWRMTNDKPASSFSIRHCRPLALVLLLAGSSGCVHRSLTVITEPPGARIYINDELKGESPVSYDFTWYGWYRLTLRKDGFERMDDRRLIKAPVYLWIPFDLVMELLPLTIRDARTWSYTLAKSAELPTPVPPQTFTPAQEPAAVAPTAPTEEATTAPSSDTSAPSSMSPAATTPATDTPATESPTPNTERPDGTR